MESWFALLQSGDEVAAWDDFLGRYRRLVLAAIRRSAADPDDVMDVFASVCEALRTDTLARLRKYPSDGTARAKFSTWLVTVVHHLAVDWFRRRDGRQQAMPPASLTGRQQELYRLVFFERYPHAEAFELLRQRIAPALPHHEFVEDLRAAQRASNESSLRLRPRTVALPEGLADGGEGIEVSLETDEARHLLDQALASLGTAERVAVQLFILNGMPAAEVARTVGWPDAKSVYNRVYRLLKSLRRGLENRGIQPGDL